MNFQIISTTNKLRNYEITIAELNGVTYFNCSRLVKDLFITNYINKHGFEPTIKEQSKAFNRFIARQDLWDFIVVSDQKCITDVDRKTLIEFHENKRKRTMEEVSLKIPFFYCNNTYRGYEQSLAKGTYLPIELIDLILVIMDHNYLIQVSGVLDKIDNMSKVNNLSFETQAKVVIKTLNQTIINNKVMSLEANTEITSDPFTDLNIYDSKVKNNKFNQLIADSILHDYFIGDTKYKLFKKYFKEFVDFTNKYKEDIITYCGKYDEHIFTLDLQCSLIENSGDYPFVTLEEFDKENREIMKAELVSWLRNFDKEDFDFDDKSINDGLDKDDPKYIRLLAKRLYKDYVNSDPCQPKLIEYVQNHFDERLLEYTSYIDFILENFEEIFVRFLLLGVTKEINSQQHYIEQIREEQEELNEVKTKFKELKTVYEDFYIENEKYNARIQEYIYDKVSQAEKKFNLTHEQQLALKHKLLGIIDKKNKKIDEVIRKNYKPIRRISDLKYEIKLYDIFEEK